MKRLAADPVRVGEDVREKAARDRLRRAEGQLRGVARMIEAGRGCEEIVTQLMAVRTAVDRVAGEIVMAHVDECVASLPKERARTSVGRAVRLLGRVS